jgi:flagellar basal body-associated protein FliL
MTIEELEEKANEPYPRGKGTVAVVLAVLLLITFCTGVAVGYFIF